MLNNRVWIEAKQIYSHTHAEGEHTLSEAHGEMRAREMKSTRRRIGAEAEFNSRERSGITQTPVSVVLESNSPIHKMEEYFIARRKREQWRRILSDDVYEKKAVEIKTNE